jgi:hypothetical protein
VAIEFGFGIIHWDGNKNSGIQFDQYLCILLCVRVCLCAYTSVLGQTNGLMDSLCGDIHLYLHCCTCVILHVYTIAVVGGSSKILFTTEWTPL